jgi:hypothetical protein
MLVVTMLSKEKKKAMHNGDRQTQQIMALTNSEIQEQHIN